MKRTSRPQDISWFLDENQSKRLNLDPPYQRRSAWTTKDRRTFLDTIFRNYPCPAIFLHKEIRDGNTVYNVVDGKQRLETIIMFSEGRIALDKAFGHDDLNGKRWDQLSDAWKRAFWDYLLPVEHIDFSEASINEAFNRLNRNSRKLEPQEIRHSQFDGWFINFVESECQDPLWAAFGITSPARVRRMKDSQFISELALVVIENKIHGFDQDFLTDAYARYDDFEEAGTVK